MRNRWGIGILRGCVVNKPMWVIYGHATSEARESLWREVFQGWRQRRYIVTPLAGWFGWRVEVYVN